MTTSNDGLPYWCIQCGVYLRADQVEGVEECPNCDAHSIPCRQSEQVLISINVQELRVISIWSEFYAKAIGKQGLVYSITNRIEAQYPEVFADNPITLAGEIALIKKTWPDVKVIGPDGEEDKSFE